jgi:hypothetical protein
MVEAGVLTLITERATKGVCLRTWTKRVGIWSARGETLEAFALGLALGLCTSLLQRVSSRRVCERPSLTQYPPSPSHPTQDGTLLSAILIPDRLHDQHCNIGRHHLPAQPMSSRTTGFFEQDQRSKVSLPQSSCADLVQCARRLSP